MKKLAILLGLVVLVLVASPALAVKPADKSGGGGPNGTKLTWSGGYAYYLRTGSGLVQQWSPAHPTGPKHIVLKPVSHFPNAEVEGCEIGVVGSGIWNPDGFSWVDEDWKTIYDAADYFYCVYNW